MANMRALELLRKAATFDLQVDSCLELLGSAGKHASDMCDALRYLAWALQQAFDLREARDKCGLELLLEDVLDVCAWVRKRATLHRNSAARAQSQLEKKVQELFNLGYCMEEIYGDSPLGDRMHTRDRYTHLAGNLARVWGRFERVAQELHEACKTLADPDRSIREAYVEVDFLPLQNGVPFPRFMWELAEEAASHLDIRLCFGDRHLIIAPHGDGVQSSADGCWLLKGGATQDFQVGSFIPAEGEATMAIRYRGVEVFPTQTLVTVRKTPKAIHIHGAIESESGLHVPLINVSHRAGIASFGFCTSGCCTQTSRWLSREVFMALVRTNIGA